MNLYQITQEFLELASMIEDAGGEVNDSILEELAISRENFAHKAQGYTSLILKWESEIEAAAAEIKRIQSLKKVKENSVSRMKEALLFALQAFGQEDAKGVKRYDTALFKLSTRKSQAVEITDEDSLPQNCFVVKREVSKTAIKHILDAGMALEGASMKENVSLQIR